MAFLLSPSLFDLLAAPTTNADASTLAPGHTFAASAAVGTPLDPLLDEAEAATLPHECASEETFRLELNASTEYDERYVKHRADVWHWSKLPANVTFECRNDTVLSRLYGLRNSSKGTSSKGTSSKDALQILVVGNGPLDTSLQPECIDTFEEVVRFNDFSTEPRAGRRTTVHVVNSVTEKYAEDAWVVLSLECAAPDVHLEDERLCAPNAESRAMLCSSPPKVQELRDANEWDGGDDDPSRGFLLATLFSEQSLLRLVGFTDDGAHASGTVDEGGEHLIDAHHIREEHLVMNAAGIGLSRAHVRSVQRVPYVSHLKQ